MTDSSNSSMVWTEEEVRYLQAMLSWSDEEDHGVMYIPERPTGQFMFLVLGAEGCGKTSILERFCHGTFNTTEDQPPDPEEQERGYRHSMKIEDETYILHALELPSQYISDEERLRQALQITEAAVLVYDVKSRVSFTLVQDIYNRIHGILDETRVYGLALVGNSTECRDAEREVSWAEGCRLAQSFRHRCMYLETSAKTGENVDILFPQLAEEVLKLRWLNYQQREEAGRSSADAQEGFVDASPSKRLARWKSWARPWFQRKASVS
ncbi:hypothetical protein M426DRAFT_7181 [Hypoxylon sp. CI-4A]|nr:hypothetical protein M426DRAFT_7181 [Hypoxylon sp. CI-4A]